MNITRGQVLRYTLLPEVMPRTAALFNLSFVNIAYYIAFIFQIVRLLPAHHPYLQAKNIGRFTVAQVLAQAATHISFDRKHLDQVGIYGAVMLGVVLFFLQLLILLLSALIPAAMAFTPPTTLDGYLATDNPDNDIAFMLLDRVFGIDGFFNSRLDVAGTFPYPYHTGLHILFQTYSTALLVVGLIIFTYFIVTIVGETVRDGTPFGKRMNRVWAPIRLVLAFGLLIPIGVGLNAGQYIVLTAAKWGSGLATNGLEYYYAEIDAAGAGQTPFGPVEQLLAQPNLQDPQALLHFALTARACEYSHRKAHWDHERNMMGSEPVRAYVLREDADGNPRARPLESIYNSDTGEMLGPVVFSNIVRQVGYDQFVIIFGERHRTRFADMPGHVFPTCGIVTMDIVNPTDDFILEVQAAILEHTIARAWFSPELRATAVTLAENRLNDLNTGTGSFTCADTGYPHCGPREYTHGFKQDFQAAIMADLATALEAVVTANINSLNYCAETDVDGNVIDPYYLSRGWAGAAICYTKLAQINGDFTSAVVNLPEIRKYPDTLERIAVLRRQDLLSQNPVERFNPSTVIGNRDLAAGFGNDREVAYGTYEAYSAWLGDGFSPGGSDMTPRGGGNITRDIINLIFGTNGIFNMVENADVHPLAQLASAGKGMVEASIRNIGGAVAGSGLAMMFPQLAAIGQMGSSFLLTFATISIVAGFILFYMIPFMPFLYFFFAVGGWIKGIFEAMVGVPLWALAHLRIDGEGMPGQAAIGGYYLIFEVFLRPILILFGLIASSLIFVAMVKVLNELWTLAVVNLTGFDATAARDGEIDPFDMEFWRGPIDEFFFTVTYVIIVYMMALASFKLVDLIPNSIMRWMGAAVTAFGEMAGDPAAKLQSTTTIGFSATSTQMMSGVEQGQSAMQTIGASRQARVDVDQQLLETPPPRQQ